MLRGIRPVASGKSARRPLALQAARRPESANARPQRSEDSQGGGCRRRRLRQKKNRSPEGLRNLNPYTFEKITVPLVPPKPNELERAVVISAFVVSVTIGRPSNSGSRLSILIEGAMKPSRIIRRQ